MVLGEAANTKNLWIPKFHVNNKYTSFFQKMVNLLAIFSFCSHKRLKLTNY